MSVLRTFLFLSVKAKCLESPSPLPFWPRHASLTCSLTLPTGLQPYSVPLFLRCHRHTPVQDLTWLPLCWNPLLLDLHMAPSLLQSLYSKASILLRNYPFKTAAPYPADLSIALPHSNIYKLYIIVFSVYCHPPVESFHEQGTVFPRNFTLSSLVGLSLTPLHHHWVALFYKFERLKIWDLVSCPSHSGQL